MSQIKLRNNTGSTAKVGDLVRVNPLNRNSFIKVTDLSQLPVIGTVATSAPSGNSCLINLINEGSGQSGIIFSPYQPTNPSLNTIWINTSET